MVLTHDSCSSFIFLWCFFNVITQLFLLKKEQMCKTGHLCLLLSKVSILVKPLYYIYVVYIIHPDMWWWRWLHTSSPTQHQCLRVEIPAVFFLVRFLIFRTEVVILSHGSHLEVMRSHDLPKESRVKINGSNLLYSQSTQEILRLWCTYGCFMIQI